jgi:hypothetical protein
MVEFLEGVQPVLRPLPTQDNKNTDKNIVGFEHTIQMYKRAKTFRALDYTATHNRFCGEKTM